MFDFTQVTKIDRILSIQRQYILPQCHWYKAIQESFWHDCLAWRETQRLTELTVEWTTEGWLPWPSSFFGRIKTEEKRMRSWWVNTLVLLLLLLSFCLSVCTTWDCNSYDRFSFQINCILRQESAINFLSFTVLTINWKKNGYEKQAIVAIFNEFPMLPGS